MAEIVKTVLSCSSKSEAEIIKSRIKAFEISRSALWKNLIFQYYEAYSFALGVASGRADKYIGKQPQGQAPQVHAIYNVRPEWKKVLVQQNIPSNLEGLVRLSKNLWWCWNAEGSEIFEMVNNARWHDLKFNPIALLESLTYKELKELSSNEKFTNRLSEVVGNFDAYMARANEKPPHTVAYFSMEYGLHDTLKIYSGGLGLLAGDYLKEATDSNYNMVGIGLLYRYGYFQQRLSINGDQIATYLPQKFTHMPIIPATG